MVPGSRQIIRKALRIFGEMLLGSRLDKFVERERRVIIGEFHRRFPTSFGFELEKRRQKALYSGIWLERFAAPLGDPRSVESLTLDDLEVFYRRHYNPSNMSIVAVGGLKLQEMVRLIAESPLGAGISGFRNLSSTLVTDFQPLSDRGGQLVISQHMTLAKPMETGGYESYAQFPGGTSPQSLKILFKMLDAVLIDEVRSKRAWAYHIGTDWTNYRGFFELEIECRGLELGALEDIGDTIEVAIASLFDREDLFRKLRGRWLASLKVNDISGQRVRDETMDDLKFFGRIITLAEMVKDVNKLEFVDIRKVLERMKPELRWTMVVNP
jgi:predicted Zn-dependent peptidase